MSDLPKDPKAWAEFVRGINYADHKKALVGLGAAAATGIGVGTVLTLRHRKLKVDFADRRFEEKGVVSVVETGRSGKVAAGLPTDEDSYDRVSDGHEIFIMDENGVNHPTQEDFDAGKEGTLRRIGNWFVEHFTSQAEDNASEREGAQP